MANPPNLDYCPHPVPILCCKEPPQEVVHLEPAAKQSRAGSAASVHLLFRHRREVVLFNSLLPPELGTRVGTAICMWKERDGNEESESCSTQSWPGTRRKGGDSEMCLVSAQWKRRLWCYHLWTISVFSDISELSEIENLAFCQGMLNIDCFKLGLSFSAFMHLLSVNL